MSSRCRSKRPSPLSRPCRPTPSSSARRATWASPSARPTETVVIRRLAAISYKQGTHRLEGNVVTEAVKQKLQQELDELDQELRVELPKQIKTAKEWGDLREKAEHHAAIARPPLSKVPHGKAAYGSSCVLYDAEREEEFTYRLVTPEESDPNAGLISTTSPVGRSLMGRAEGDEV